MPSSSSSSSSSHHTPRQATSSSSSTSSNSKIADYYSLLGVSHDASVDDIRHAFYDICRRYHPDKVKTTTTPNDDIKSTTTTTTTSSITAMNKEKKENNTIHSNADKKKQKDDDDVTVTTSQQEQLRQEEQRQQQHVVAASSLQHWTAIQAAWKCLSNDTKRIIYDIKMEGRMVTKEDSNRLLTLLKAQADRDIDNMQHEYVRILNKEKKRHGIIIIKALFGNLNGDHNGNIEGPYIDVTIPLQCTVDTHKVILAAGLAKSDIPGFYNPIPLHLQQQYYHRGIQGGDTNNNNNDDVDIMEASLYVVYEFKGRLHEVIVNDTDPLWLPLKSHILPQGADLRGPILLLQANTGNNNTQEMDDDNNNNATTPREVTTTVGGDDDTVGNRLIHFYDGARDYLISLASGTTTLPFMVLSVAVIMMIAGGRRKWRNNNNIGGSDGGGYNDGLTILSRWYNR